MTFGNSEMNLRERQIGIARRFNAGTYATSALRIEDPEELHRYCVAEAYSQLAIGCRQILPVWWGQAGGMLKETARPGNNQVTPEPFHGNLPKFSGIGLDGILDRVGRSNQIRELNPAHRIRWERFQRNSILAHGEGFIGTQSPDRKAERLGRPRGTCLPLSVPGTAVGPAEGIDPGGSLVGFHPEVAGDDRGGGADLGRSQHQRRALGRDRGRNVLFFRVKNPAVGVLENCGPVLVHLHADSGLVADISGGGVKRTAQSPNRDIGRNQISIQSIPEPPLEMQVAAVGKELVARKSNVITIGQEDGFLSVVVNRIIYKAIPLGPAVVARFRCVQALVKIEPVPLVGGAFV